MTHVLGLQFSSMVSESTSSFESQPLHGPSIFTGRTQLQKPLYHLCIWNALQSSNEGDLHRQVVDNRVTAFCGTDAVSSMISTCTLEVRWGFH